ncbi:uncharacterized protein PGTG_19846 [Puccinia graminis f. sp. tritici CRL 75-36-700-3]|uniref:Uncharacterized protein n=1 Tax=Puccinia graminis f. sp. tritici (strain CRL 75-36-700-3 / race SCCL) TaxID=418459 RepID=E3LB76_PUCGT|nr:uncharacterized protein PGTG_19846 [Puccinia graminis f. sp. tritici CRL 75-36-700-3]EFP93801.1 hypothetical protein PGTG_19846 [Puccinia graminis f. sp. tritici CRL 75-36-700-3]
MDLDTLHFEYFLWDLEEEVLIQRLLAAAARPIPRMIQIGDREIILRNRIAGNECLMANYFVKRPVYPNRIFERRFRMSKNLFNQICSDLQQHDRFWILKEDCCGQMGLSTHQKVTAALRLLAYGSSADSVDEYV